MAYVDRIILIGCNGGAMELADVPGQLKGYEHHDKTHPFTSAAERV